MAISAHGCSLTRNGVVVLELGDVLPPALVRKSVEDTRHPDADDAYVLGFSRYGHLVFDMAVTPASVEGFLSAWLAHALDAYVLTFADGTVWSFFGHVVDVSPHESSVDDAFRARVTVQVSGGIRFSVEAHDDSLLLETGDYVLLESGDTILLEH
jgi:hypothetical protein